MIRVALTALAAVLLAGCTPQAPAGQPQDNPASAPYVVSVWVDTVDGRRIPCVWAALGYGGGFSCDWSSR